MAKVIGVDRLKGKLKKLAERGRRVTYAVGYEAGYAIYVHEDLEARHEVGQAKFLEQPARQMRRELGGMIAGGMKKGMTLDQSVMLAALRLQAESQRLVPVDTGNLRASAFTRKE